MEDEEPLLEIGRVFLERQGYTVLATRSPVEALRMAGEFPGEIQMVMTDVIMPDMNGRELVERLQALRPSMKSLYMSGYTANVIAHHGVLDPGVCFIEKPFSLTDLAEKVREVLDKCKNPTTAGPALVHPGGVKFMTRTSRNVGMLE